MTAVENYRKPEKSFKSLSSIIDYKLLSTNTKNIDLQYFENQISEKILDLNRVKRLKISQVTSDSEKQDNILNFLAKIFQKHDIKELCLDFKDLRNMKNFYLQKIQEQLNNLKSQLKVLECNFSKWSYKNENISQEGCIFINNFFNYQNSMHTLKLDLAKWGQNNSQINDNSVSLITQGVSRCQNLKQLDLDFQSWGCEDIKSTGHISDKSGIALSNMLESLGQVEILKLNLRSWGYSNQKLTDITLIQMGQAFKNMGYLKSVDLNLYCWGFQNQKITGSGLEQLLYGFQNNQQNIENINLNCDSWSWNQKISQNLETVNNSTVNKIFEIFADFEKLKEFKLNLNNWGWKNRQITGDCFTSVKKFLVKQGDKLQVLDLNFNKWWSYRSQFSSDDIDELSSGLQSCQNLRELALNLDSLGYKNKKIKKECIENLFSSLQNYSRIRKLQINLQCWGVEENNSFQILDDELITVLYQSLKEMTLLKQLELNLNSWGYKNNNITDKNLKLLSSLFYNELNNIVELNLGLRNWGYQNEEITDKSLNCLTNIVQNLKNIEKLIIDVDNWGDGNSMVTYQQFNQFLKTVMKKKYLRQCVINHSSQDWNNGTRQQLTQELLGDKHVCEQYLQQIQEKIQKKQMINMQMKGLQQQYKHIFRKELIGQIAEVFIQ